MIQTQPLEISDFSLGVTDYFKDGGDLRAAEVMDNLIITPNKKLQTRWGSIVRNVQLPSGTVRISRITHLETLSLAFQGKKAYYDNAGTFTEIVGPASGAFFPDGGNDSVIVSTEWRKHLFLTNDEYSSPQKFYINDANAKKVVNAGLPAFPTGTSISAASGAGTDYLYAFCLYRSYKVGTLTFEDRGPTFTYATTVTGGVISSGNKSTITLPTALTTVENWPSSEIKIEVYRTQASGDVFYRVAVVNLGTASYQDGTPDADLVFPLYTTGGIADNDPPPKAKIVHVVNDYGYYANIKTGTEIDASLIRQSKYQDPDSVPEEFFAQTEQPIVGFSSIFDRPLAFCTKYIYRVDGSFADDGSNGFVLKRIDDEAGCVSALSIVRTHLGIFWAGQEGFYWSDGIKVLPISEHINLTYKLFTSSETRNKRIQGTFDSSNQRIYWSVCRDDGVSNEPDFIYCLDLKFQTRTEDGKLRGSFSTWSGASFVPTALDYLNGVLYRGDKRGYVLEHSEDYFVDPKIDTNVAATAWEDETIIHTWSSIFTNFGQKVSRKWVPRVLVSADNPTNVSIGISSSNDNNRIVGDLKPILYSGNVVWGGSLPYWGDNSVLWNTEGTVEEWRRFPAGGLRCSTKQVTLTNALREIIDSDILGAVTVDVALGTATLGGTYEWPDGMVGYFIRFSHNDYMSDLEITAQTTTTLTFDDPDNLGPLVNGSYNFRLMGYPKGEVLALNSVVLHWAPISRSHTPFSASSLGSNPA